MVKKEAHIDILFRERLNELEILPPTDLWEDISPAISKKFTGFNLLRIAAGVAALATIGLLSYLIGTSTIPLLQQPLTASLESDPALFTPATETVNLFPGQTSGVSTISGTDSQGVENNTFSEATAEEQERSSPIELKGSVYADVDDSVTNAQYSLAYNQSGSESIDQVLNAQQVSGTLDPYQQPIEETELRKWEVGARLSPTYLSSNLMATNRALSELQDDESSVMSYSGGVSVSYKMNGRLSVHTGLFYSTLGREISGINAYSGFADYASTKSGRIFGIETSTGSISSTNRDIFLADAASSRISGEYTADNFDPLKADLTPIGSVLRQNFQYIEIPLMVSYKLVDRKIDFNILGGMSYNFLLDNQAYVVGGGERTLIGSTDNMTALLLSSALGMSMEYNLSNRISLNLEPSFRYYLNSGGTLSIKNPYSVGIYSGFSFKF